jgi:hypothetical protein
MSKEKWHGRGQEIEREEEHLLPVPGDAERIERELVDHEVRAERRSREREAECGRGWSPTPHRKQRSAGSSSQQGQADRHERKMVELLDREQAQQCELEQ